MISGITKTNCKTFVFMVVTFSSLSMMFALYRAILPTPNIPNAKQQLPVFFTTENNSDYIEPHMKLRTGYSVKNKTESSKTKKDIQNEYSNPIGKYKGIPKIIHQIWKDDDIPEIFQENIKGLVAHNKPPEWKYYFWTDENGEKFIKNMYPSLLPRFLSAREILKADILRLAVIYHYGGVYFDLDTVSVKPLDAYVENHNCSFTTDPPEHFLRYHYNSPALGKIITNCVLLCKPRNWFIWYAMEQLFNQSKKCNNAIECTGPGFITKAYEKLQSTNRSIHLPPLEDYQLFTDKLAVHDIKNFVSQRCTKSLERTQEDWRKAVCREFVKRGGLGRNISEKAYTYHTWFHISMNLKKINEGTRRKVKQLVPHVFFYAG